MHGPEGPTARGISMAGLLFVSQAMLDSWTDQGKIDFVGNVMTLLAGDGKGRSYALEPAVRFMKVLGEVADPNQLVHKVKPLSQLKEMGAEPAGDSCILGDVAYEVQPGFLAEASVLQAAAAAPSAPAPRKRPAEDGRSKTFGNAPMPKDLEEKRKEAEALARFLLDNLS
jgi:hypothetical protein